MSLLRRKQGVFSTLCFVFASATQRCFLVQLSFKMLFSLHVLPVFLLFFVAAVLALQAVTTFVVVFEKLCIEMLSTELGIAIVARVRSYILRMVAFLSASLAH